MKIEIEQDDGTVFDLRQNLGSVMAELLGSIFARSWLKEEGSERVVAEYEETAEKFANDMNFSMDEKELRQALMKVQTSMSEWLTKNVAKRGEAP